MALRRMEKTIGAAINKRRPKSQYWGPIDASQFLAILNDVTTFSLSEFAGGKPVAPMATSRFVANRTIRIFARRPVPHKDAGTTVIRNLRGAGNVGLRRCALFMAYELMYVRSARTWVSQDELQSRPLRLARILARQNSDGLTWLSERMCQWPREYREYWWRGSNLVLAQ